MAASLKIAKYHSALQDLTPVRYQGRVIQVIGLSIDVEGLNLRIGEICHIYPANGQRRISAEVVGFKEDRLVMMPFADTEGLKSGAAVLPGRRLFTVPVGDELLGRVVDALCQPIDGNGPLGCIKQYPLNNTPPHPLRRLRIDAPLETGIRAVDGILTCGKGQRIGIFSGSGVGKSTLVGQIARHATCDVSVIALIGERGREVQEFIERDLGEKGLQRSVLIVSTSDQPPLLRLKGAWVATAIAEYFRDQGADVVFIMDSVTRVAMAQREIGLAVGEPPATKGYPPSVFALLPRLMERAGTSDKGTITGFYSVLVEGDDPTEPISDTARSVLDGHIMLSRDLARENHYPAIDILDSVSRVMPAITSKEHQEAANKLRSLVAAYRNAQDLINTGAYAPGSNLHIDEALTKLPAINAFLRQGNDEFCTFDQTVSELTKHFSG